MTIYYLGWMSSYQFLTCPAFSFSSFQYFHCNKLTRYFFLFNKTKIKILYVFRCNQTQKDEKHLSERPRKILVWSMITKGAKYTSGMKAHYQGLHLINQNQQSLRHHHQKAVYCWTWYHDEWYEVVRSRVIIQVLLLPNSNFNSLCPWQNWAWKCSFDTFLSCSNKLKNIFCIRNVMKDMHPKNLILTLMSCLPTNRCQFSLSGFYNMVEESFESTHISLKPQGFNNYYPL